MLTINNIFRKQNIKLNFWLSYLKHYLFLSKDIYTCRKQWSNKMHIWDKNSLKYIKLVVYKNIIYHENTLQSSSKA